MPRYENLSRDTFVDVLQGVAADALQDLHLQEARGFAPAGVREHMEDMLLPTRLDVGIVVNELRRACEARPLPHLCEAEKLVLVKVFATLLALLLKLQQHKDVPLRLISTMTQAERENQEEMAMPRSALADPVAWLQAELQLPRCSDFLGGVLASTTLKTLQQLSQGHCVPACFTTSECKRLMRHNVTCMDQWAPLYHGALAIYLAHPGLLMDGKHQTAVSLLRPYPTPALPGGEPASLQDLFASHAAPAMRQLLRAESMLRTKRLAATARLEAAITELLEAQPLQPSFLGGLQHQIQRVLRKASLPRKEQAQCSSPRAGGIPAVHRPTDSLLEPGSTSSAPVGDAAPKRRSLMARLLCCFMGSQASADQGELCWPAAPPCSPASSCGSACSLEDVPALPAPTAPELPMPVPSPAGCSPQALHNGSDDRAHLVCSAGPIFNLLD